MEANNRCPARRASEHESVRQFERRRVNYGCYEFIFELDGTGQALYLRICALPA
jgi:hypothetical protein